MRKAATMGATDKVKDDSKPSALVGFSLPTSPLGENSLKVTPSRSPYGSPASASDREQPFTSVNPKFYKKGPEAKKGRSIVAMDHQLQAIIESKLEANAQQNENISTENKQWLRLRPGERPLPELPTKKGVQTFRVWGPEHNQKSIKVKVGSAEENFDAEKIFEASRIRTRTYKQWRQEAKALLPSNAGQPIEQLADLIKAVPTLLKEHDPRARERAIRRLSYNSQESGPKSDDSHKRKKPTPDYTKVREIHWTPSLVDDSESRVTLTIDNDSGDDESLLLEQERQLAGIDIKAKIQTLKQVSDHLSKKRKIRQQLVEQATGQSVMDSEEIPIKEQILYLIENLGNVLHDILYFFIIWEKQIQQINGRFGIVNANYFIWLRQLIGLEIITVMLAFIIIIIPEIADHHEGDDNFQKLAHRGFRFNDLITGEGSLRHTYLYYTGYKGKHEHSHYPFENTAFRFLFLLIVKFVLTSYFIFSRLSKYYRSTRMESTVSGVADMDNFKAVVCGWDFSCRDPQAKTALHKNIRREMKYLAEKARSKEPGNAVAELDIEHKKLLAFLVKYFGLFWGAWIIHIGGTFLALAACALDGVALFYMCKWKLYYYLKCVSLRDDGVSRDLDNFLCPNGNEYLETSILVLPALFASLTTVFVIKFIVHVGDLETWSSAERKIYATIFRAGLFYFTNIGVFYYFWWNAKPTLNKEGFVAEAIFGAELYRLVVIQGLIDIILNFVVRGLIHVIRRKSKKYKLPEFRTESYCLSMFFIHSVSRIGAFFSPPLGIFVAGRMIVEFYQNKFILTHLSSQEGYSVHMSHIYAPFLLTFFILCYLITNFLNVYYLTDTAPSVYDGPFQHYSSYGEVLVTLLSSKKKTSWIIYILQPGFLTTLLIILGALAYFCRRWALDYEPLMVHLNDLIIIERGDRDILLKAIYSIGQVTRYTSWNAAPPKTPKVRRAAMLVGRKKEDTTSVDGDEGDDEEEDEDSDDNSDDHIEALIQHVRNRKTLAAIEVGHIHHQVGRTSMHPDYLRRSLMPRNRTKLSEGNPHKEHLEHMESIVARIVDTRRRKSMMGLPHLQGKDSWSHPAHISGENRHLQFAGQPTIVEQPAAKEVVSNLIKDLAVKHTFGQATSAGQDAKNDLRKKSKK